MTVPVGSLNYLGPAPTGNPTPSNDVVCTTAEASTLYGGTVPGQGYALTAAEVATLINSVTPGLTTVSATTAAFAPYMTVAQVAAGEAGFLNQSQVGASGGIATLGSDGLILPQNIPGTTIVNNRSLSNGVTQGYSSGFVGGQTSTIGTPVISAPVVVPTSTGIGNGYLLSKLTLTYPGWPYIPLVFGWVMGDSGGPVGAPPSPQGRVTGNGWYGEIHVMNYSDSSDSTVYGYARCTDTPYPNLYPLIPYTLVPTSVNNNTTGTPTNGLTSSINLGMYGVASGGTGYRFYDTPMVFFAIAFPAHQAVTA